MDRRAPRVFTFLRRAIAPFSGVTKAVEELSTEPVMIAEGTYWVGRREPGSLFYANPYLRVFRGPNGVFPMLVDPGASSEFSVVRTKISQVVPSLAAVRAVWINHQDPDVGSIVGPLLQRFAPHARVLCSEETWRLIRFFGIPQNRYVCVDPYKKAGIRLPTGHRLLPVPSPYCHFVGATMLYDLDTQVLFTGDLFGGLTAKGAKGLYADASDWAGMRAFHQLYMPARRALAYAVEAIRSLDPAPRILAPQHGRVIQGDHIEHYLERIACLDVGVDLIDDRDATEETLHAWSSVLTRVIEAARCTLGPTAEARVIDDQDLADCLVPSGGGVQIARLGKWVVERAVHLLTEQEPPEVASSIRYEAVLAAAELELPTPNVDLTEGAPIAAPDDDDSWLRVAD